MIDFDFNSNCYGCRNCEIICPQKAIKIRENDEGFLIPSVDINLCVKCGLCEKKCPYLNFKKMNTEIKEKKWYSCYLRDLNDRINSTSGGVFPVLAEYFIKNNGYVCGCIWNDEMKPVHILSNKIEDVNKMRGSKYLQSNLEDVFSKIKKVIDTNIVLFTGTPCQIAAVKLYIGEHKNLYTCGLICEGAGSVKVWKKYKNYLECKYNAKLIKASFRNKEIGWDSPITAYEFDNGKTIKTLSYEFDWYVKGFLQALYYRNSCNTCQYKGNGHNSDILIGDLWGANKELLDNSENKGISAVIINSEKGKEIFNFVLDKFVFAEVNPDNVITYNKLLMEPINKNINRDKFYNQIDNIDIVKNIKNNIKVNFLRRWIKEFLYKIKLFKFLKGLK